MLYKCRWVQDPGDVALVDWCFYLMLCQGFIVAASLRLVDRPQSNGAFDRHSAEQKYMPWPET